uniref:Uncharacterized protein n=1 Tax=Oryza brachyantha TaxID=4533 RepID=J3MHN6_ORYBR
ASVQFLSSSSVSLLNCSTANVFLCPRLLCLCYSTRQVAFFLFCLATKITPLTCGLFCFVYFLILWG